MFDEYPVYYLIPLTTRKSKKRRKIRREIERYWWMYKIMNDSYITRMFLHDSIDILLYNVQDLFV